MQVSDVEDHVPQLRCGGVEQPTASVEVRDGQDVGQLLQVVVGTIGGRGEQNLGVAVDQLLAKLSRGREGGKRDDDGADSRCCQHADDKLNAIGVKQSDMA